MKNNIRALAISFCCMLALLGTFLALKFLSSEDDDKKKSHLTAGTDESVSSISLIKTEIKEIKEIAVKNQDSEFKIEVVDDGDEPNFKLEALEKAGKSPSKDLVKYLAQDLCNFSASKIISENPQDDEKYGLKEPKATIKVSFKDSTSKTLLLGENTSFDSGAYLKIDEEDKIYLISMSDASIFLNTPENYAEVEKEHSDKNSP
ncbi:MAG: DUF4340 domain-containing protein [Oscillospiraceae bacterium]|jgi:hypothetical protein|nr:DUF4340 domain-containing protein [Oscillospiraceae bacterium]